MSEQRRGRRASCLPRGSGKVRETVVGAAALLFMWGGAISVSGQSPLPELVPAGWTLRTSTNSIYFTRPDLPNVQVGLVNDLRTDLTSEEKFEAAKAFFAERTDCPALATAETKNSFAGYSASDDDEAPRCHLIGMGHWREGGLQMALILNTTAQAGPKPGDGAFEAILDDVIQYFMLRYEIGDRTDVELDVPPETHAGQVERDNKPTTILRLIDETEHFIAAMTSLDIMNREPGEPIPRRDRSVLPVLLFGPGGGERVSFGSLCTDWDPGLFSPSTILRYHAMNECFRFEWRWADGSEGSGLEVKPVGGDWITAAEHLREERDVGFRVETPYRKIRRGATFDFQVGLYPSTVGRVARGELPISALGPNDAILGADGTITLGHLQTATLPSPAESEGPYRPVTGTYFFDGHVITIKLDDGHVVHGFTGWVPGADETEVGSESTLMINGVHYFRR